MGAVTAGFACALESVAESEDGHCLTSTTGAAAGPAQPGSRLDEGAEGTVGVELCRVDEGRGGESDLEAVVCNELPAPPAHFFAPAASHNGGKERAPSSR